MAKETEEKQVTKRHSGMWVKGQSGNPAGRPSRAKETRYLKIMHEVVSDDVWMQICERAAKDAIDGSHPARRWLADYTVGPPIKQTDITVKGDTSLVGAALDKRLALMASMLMAVIENRDQIADKAESADLDVIDGVIMEKDE